MAGIYIHIPFCHSKCAYCDFYSLGAPVEALMRRYAAAIVAEWKSRWHELADERVATLYIGGGTPSALPMPLLRQIVNGLAENGIDIDALDEFTVEANPEDMTDKWLRETLSLGANRISMGVQSFDDGALARVSRRHSGSTAKQALEILKDSGINYSADLIYGLPGQTLDDWRRDLDILLGYRPPHFSAYLLSYEPGTPLHARLMRGEVTEASEQLACDMYSALCRESLAAGYRHYEISAFGLPGREARHNSSYWDYTPYLGLGCAAHSLAPDGVRRFNPSNILSYLDAIEQGKTAVEADEESETDRLNDYIITALRTDTGLDLAFMRDRWGDKSTDAFIKSSAHFIVSGKLASSGQRIRIPESSWLTADSILRELIF